MLASMCYRLLLAGATLMAVSSARADNLTPLQLVAPDATVVIGINSESIRQAYARSRYRELLTPEYRAQYEQQAQAMKGMLGFDLTQLQEIVVGVRPGQPGASGQGLLVVRGSFDPDHPPALLALMPTQRSTHQGVTLMISKQDKGDPLAIAFLGRTMLVAGDPASVRAAISRWQAGVAAHSPWLARAEQMHRTFHVWCLTHDLQSVAPHGVALSKDADAVERAMQSVEEITAGMTLAPDFKASVEMLANTAKDAAALQGAVSMVMALAMAQSGPQKAKDLLKGIEITTQERTVRLSLAIPEEQLMQLVKERMKQGTPWWKGTPLGPSGGARVKLGQQPPQSTEVTVQGSEPAARHAAKADDTQVIVLPK